jgi:phosphonate transport system permease protein
LGAIALSLWQTGIFQQDIFNPGGGEQFWRFLGASLHPDLQADLLRLTLDASLKTLAYAVCGTFLSVILGLVGGVLCSEVWWEALSPRSPKGIHRIILSFRLMRALLAVPRAIHELIWGLFFVNLFGLDPLVAVLAIAIPFGAITAKVFSELLDETPREPLRVLLNSGAPPLSAFCYSLLPQASLELVSYTFYRFECSIRSAAVLGIIGAGGLGYQIMLSLQSLRYEQLWTFFYALFLLNGAVDFTSAWVRRRLGCATRLDLNAGGRAKGVPSANARSTRDSKSSRWIGWLCCGVLLSLLIFSFGYVGADFGKLWSSVTWQRLGTIAHSSFPPDWQVASQLTKLSWQTVAMSVLAIALAATGGMVLAFPAAHNFFLPGGLLNSTRVGVGGRIWAWAVLLFSRAILLMARAVPAPIWALAVLYVTLPGILPGAIALGLHNLGILGRLKAEVIENLDQRPLEALKGLGAPAPLLFLYGVLPLTLPRFLAYDLYRWEVCMRETVIVGLVGAGGLGRVLTEQLSSFDYRGMVVTLGGFILLTFLVDWISSAARRSLR